MKKILAVVLAVLMIVSVVPIALYAMEDSILWCDMCQIDVYCYEREETYISQYYYDGEHSDPSSHLVSIWLYECCGECGIGLRGEPLTDSLEGHRMENGVCTDCGYSENN